MTQEENLALARLGVDIFNSGELGRLAEIYADDVVLHTPPGWPEPGPFRGVEAAIGQFRRVSEDFGEAHVEVSGAEAHGDDVLLPMRWVVRGDHSGLEGEFRLIAIVRFRKGKVVELRYFWEDADARAALGDV
jgi:ketosteroid isomerase-like protein